MPEPRIGDLRWRVTLARRTHVVDPNDFGAVMPQELYTDQRDVQADIRPVGTAAYLAGQQLEIGAITHRITLRWQPTLTEQHVVLRRLIQPDGTPRTEVYRIHRVEAWAGRQRFSIIDAEIERTSP